MQNNKSAFTMIELIFVIAILGILTVVGIPKLAATRNDAKGAVIATRLSNCIHLAAKGYLTDNRFDVNDSNCVEIVTNLHCYIIVPNDENGTLNIKDVADATDECKAGQNITLKNKISSSAGVTHSF